MAFEVGQHVGDYEIVQLLGVGGMGHVYRVRNVISDRTEAMKVLLPDLTAERDLAIRFIAEIRTLASFDHPNIALLHTAFQADNQLIMMMEFVEGQTLEQRTKQGSMAIADVCGYTYQALSALSYAHGRGVVHRDIKPANLMLTSHGIVKLMDFGIAKSNVETNLTRPGTTIGSLYYMSPEQVWGDAVDARSDLYSVGIMLYELLAGRRPFEAETTFSILNQQLNTPPQPPIDFNATLPRALNDLVLHALAKDPAERYQSADYFRDALRPFCQSQAAEAGYAAATVVATETSIAPVPPPFTEIPVYAPVNAALPPVNSAPAAAPPHYQPAPKKSSKALWIGTGIAAALLAMVGLAIGLPHLLGTHAAESGAGPQPVTSTPADTPQRVDPPPPVAGNSVANSTVVAPEQPRPAGGVRQVAPANLSPGPGAETYKPGSSPKRAPYTGPGSSGGEQAVPLQGMAAASPAASGAELEQEQDRFTDVSARAGAVNSTIMRMRREQEAQGVGLRGDMESADNRMESYLQAADQALRAGNATSAAKNISRAEAELATLEKFLGR